MTKKAVPWNAVKILKTKKDTKSGAKAVPIENAVKSVALATDTCESKSVEFWKHHQRWPVKSRHMVL